MKHSIFKNLLVAPVATMVAFSAFSQIVEIEIPKKYTTDKGFPNASIYMDIDQSGSEWVYGEDLAADAWIQAYNLHLTKGLYHLECAVASQLQKESDAEFLSAQVQKNISHATSSFAKSANWAEKIILGPSSNKKKLEFQQSHWASHLFIESVREARELKKAGGEQDKQKPPPPGSAKEKDPVIEIWVVKIARALTAINKENPRSESFVDVCNSEIAIFD